MAKARILLTRPEEDSAPLANRLVQMGYDCITEPLLSIHIFDRPDLSETLSNVQALLFTSANGVRAFAQNCTLRHLPVFTVGQASLDCAHTFGFTQCQAAGGDVEKLGALVKSRLSPEKGALFQAAGTKLAGDLKGDLEKAGFTFLREPLYEAKTAGQFSCETCTLLQEGQIDAVLLFSPRTAKTFAKLVQKASLSKTKQRFVIGALSQAVCDAVKATHSDLAHIQTITAKQPDTDHLLEALDRYFIR